ncbi:nuclear transport factor 2 family protein [Sphingomonas montanisoli]|uniref:Nuclear transport factor 2 family protein n=1 Tax=Sphingomonas montanisoli TaxID=2606412 RepID=A0A5D9C2P4_9SPHN|nr:nuclear transport factor 2 family protein [Sphingomonas montanisoli]TZG26004.1 nuclear transport factor 2 family protein [Sphingomonas montanisoli]
MADVQGIADERAIEKLVLGYAHGVDTRSPETFTAQFAPDARLFGAGFEYRGADLAKIPPQLNRYVRTYHTVLNKRIVVDGDAGAGEIYSLAHHLTPRDDGRHDDFIMHITYHDRYARTAQGWRIAERQVVTEFTEDRIVDRKI